MHINQTLIMREILESKIQELESRLTDLREKLDSISDNNYHELTRVQLIIGEKHRELVELKRTYSMVSIEALK